MNEKSIFLTALFCSLLLCGGCTVVNKNPKVPVAPEQQQVQLAESQKIGERLLQALQKRSYADFKQAAGMSPFAKQMTEQDFATSCENTKKQFGEIKKYQFLTELTTPQVTNLVWRVTFERPSANAGGKPITQDLMFRVVTSRLDNKTVVMEAGFL